MDNAWLAAKSAHFLYPAGLLDKGDLVRLFLEAAFLCMELVLLCLLLKAVVLFLRKIVWLFTATTGVTQLTLKWMGRGQGRNLSKKCTLHFWWCS